MLGMVTNTGLTKEHLLPLTFKSTLDKYDFLKVLWYCYSHLIIKSVNVCDVSVADNRHINSISLSDPQDIFLKIML